MTYRCSWMRSANVHRCQDFLEKKRHNSLKLKVSHPSGVWQGLSQELGLGEGGHPKSPYHMPWKILLNKIVHILNICLFFVLFLFLIFSYEQLIQYFCQVQFHRPFIFDVRHCASTIKLNMSGGTLSPPQRLLWQSKIQTEERRHGKGDKASKT